MGRPSQSYWSYLSYCPPRPSPLAQRLQSRSMTFFERLTELIAAGTPVVSVTVVDTAGSVPTEKRSKMLVTAKGLDTGTVGGGKVEKRAIEEAQAMLASGETTRFFQWQLNRDIGMTCGGMVRMYLEAFNVAAWNIVVFGAGHVSNALVPILLGLDCRLTCIDPRGEWLERLPDSPRLQRIVSPDMPSEVAGIPAGSFVVLITMGHSTDMPILLEILRTRELPFIGVIGSRAKAKQLRRDVEEAGLPEQAKERFHCPVGLTIGTNHPQEIAISIAAQLLQERDRRNNELATSSPR
jgi:xanthine dehydrogenase accessory factor